jgi:hypothetical protein
VDSASQITRRRDRLHEATPWPQFGKPPVQ